MDELTGAAEITVAGAQAPSVFPLSERFARRGELVSVLNAKLNLKGVLVLKGSTGMGKSTLARLIVERKGTAWRFLNFEQAGPEETKNILLRATLADRQDNTESDYVIDDLNFDQSPLTYERQLEGFLSTIILRGGRVVITTQGDFPSRIARAFDLPDECLFVVPSLDEEEVAQVACNHGCPKDKRLEPWKRIIYAKSIGGHPLLVHAMAINLEARGWPEPNLEDLLSSDSIGDVRREFRKRLRDLLPSDGARNLLYTAVFT